VQVAPQHAIVENDISSHVPDPEAPSVFVLPDDYQRNSMESTDNYFDQADYLPYESSAVQTTVQTTAQITVPSTEAISTAPLTDVRVDEQTIIEEVNTPPATPAVPVYSAPGYSVASSPTYSGANLSEDHQQDMIKASTGNKSTQIQLARKPRGNSRVLR